MADTTGPSISSDKNLTESVQQNQNTPTRTLTGTVIDASTGEALIGVNVRVKGTTVGTSPTLTVTFPLK